MTLRSIDMHNAYAALRKICSLSHSLNSIFVECDILSAYRGIGPALHQYQGFFFVLLFVYVLLFSHGLSGIAFPVTQTDYDGSRSGETL